MFKSSSEIGISYFGDLRAMFCEDRLRDGLCGVSGDFPNPASIQELSEIIHSAILPINNKAAQVAFLIHELGRDFFARFGTPERMYVRSIYVYCNKRLPLGVEVSGDYFFLASRDICSGENGLQFGSKYLAFLEWLHSEVKSHPSYCDFFLLLSWISVRRRFEDFSDPFGQVLSELLNLRGTVADLIELNDSVVFLESWERLHGELPCLPEHEVTLRLVNSRLV